MKEKAFRLISWDRNSEGMNHERFERFRWVWRRTTSGKGWGGEESSNSLIPTKFLGTWLSLKNFDTLGEDEKVDFFSYIPYTILIWGIEWLS